MRPQSSAWLDQEAKFEDLRDMDDGKRLFRAEPQLILRSDADQMFAEGLQVRSCAQHTTPPRRAPNAPARRRRMQHDQTTCGVRVLCSQYGQHNKEAMLQAIRSEASDKCLCCGVPGLALCALSCTQRLDCVVCS